MLVKEEGCAVQPAALALREPAATGLAKPDVRGQRRSGQGSSTYLSWNIVVKMPRKANMRFEHMPSSSPSTLSRGCDMHVSAAPRTRLKRPSAARWLSEPPRAPVIHVSTTANSGSRPRTCEPAHAPVVSYAVRRRV